MCNSVGPDKEMPPQTISDEPPNGGTLHCAKLSVGRRYTLAHLSEAYKDTRLVSKEHLCPIVDRPMNVFSSKCQSRPSMCRGVRWTYGRPPRPVITVSYTHLTLPTSELV